MQRRLRCWWGLRFVCGLWRRSQVTRLVTAPLLLRQILDGVEASGAGQLPALRLVTVSKGPLVQSELVLGRHLEGRAIRIQLAVFMLLIKVVVLEQGERRPTHGQARGSVPASMPTVPANQLIRLF